MTRKRVLGPGWPRSLRKFYFRMSRGVFNGLGGRGLTQLTIQDLSRSRPMIPGSACSRVYIK